MKFLFPFLFLSQFIFGQHTALWRIQNPSNNDTSYILGSLHFIGNSIIDSMPAINIMLRCDVAVFESIDDDSVAINLMSQRKNDFSYTKYLYKSDVDYLDNISKNWTVPLSKLTPIELFIQLRRKLITTHCGCVKPTDTWSHFDNYMQYTAKKNNIPLLGLETDSSQLRDINQLLVPNYNLKAAKKAIHQQISNLKSGKNKSSYCQDVNNYLSRSFNYGFDKSCQSVNVIKRNNEWLPKIINSLKQKKTFITVGLFHLFGDCGIISQLRKQGFIVEPLI